MSTVPSPHTATFEERYVGFVDILGFKEHVDIAVTDPQKFNVLLRGLKRIATNFPHLAGPPEDFRAAAFSDSIVVSTRATHAGLWSVILACDALQFNLWPNGILLRGAITKGLMYHDADVLFGPALNSAYDLETRVSTHPRIMLAQDVYQDAIASQSINFPNYVQNYLMAAQFDVPCISPFQSFQSALAASPQHALQQLSDAKHVIETQLNNVAGKPALVAKWSWLARWFNEFIAMPALALPSTISSIVY